MTRKKYQDNLRKRSVRNSLIALYGGRCACCNEWRREFLGIDHINNDGAKHRREVGRNIYFAIWREGYQPDKYRLLCHNCNSARGLYGECPHERERREIASLSGAQLRLMQEKIQAANDGGYRT